MFTVHYKQFLLKKFVLLTLYILLPSLFFAQEESVKVKGNKILEVKTTEISEFRILEISGEFEVSLMERPESSVRVEADSNLHQYIDISVDAEKLTIKPTRNFTRTKKLSLEIGYTNVLSKILANGKVSIISNGNINVDRLAIETTENASVAVTSKTQRVDILTKGRSKVKATILAEAIGVHSNDNSEIEITATTESLNVSQNQKSELTINGKTDKSTLFLLDNTYFYGAGLESINTTLSIEGTSDAYVNVSDKLQLKASGKSEVSVLSNPVIELQTFADDTTLKKLSKPPGRINRFLK